MTVCIAAVCNFIPDRPRCVIAAADRMITIGDIEYEPEQTKSVQFASNTIGMFAGDMQLHASVVPKVLRRIDEALRENPENINVGEIADFYAEEFAYYRRMMAEREILMPRGLNFDRFLSRQATMAHWQVADLDNRLASYYINSTAIIAGIDPTGAHLYKVYDPGVAMCFDTPFFACAGSGQSLAETQFMVRQFDKTWPVERALWLTFTAKARAEKAGGVGRQTDMTLIVPGKQHILTVQEKELLYDLFREVETKEAAAAAEAEAEVLNYLQTEAAKEKTPETAQQTAAENPLDQNSTPAPAENRPKNSMTVDAEEIQLN